MTTKDGSAPARSAGGAPSGPPREDPLVGKVVADKYRVLALVAKGGMGKIYRAEQMPLGRVVALKLLQSRFTADAADDEFQRRFLLEAATCAKLKHANTVTVFDYGRYDGSDDGDTYFMVMEFVEGRTLAQHIRGEGRLPPARAARIATQIARSLREAHKLGVVHRDLKPSNVMIVESDEGESVKVLDFGLAKVLQDDFEELTNEGRFLGSPRYMAPEQIRHSGVDGRTDIYALGVILFEMLCGKVPFEGDQAVQTLMRHISDPVPSFASKGVTDVPPELEALVMKCLEKKPDGRFADIDALIRALTSLGPILGVDARLLHPSSSGAWPAMEPLFPSDPPSSVSGSRSADAVTQAEVLGAGRSGSSAPSVPAAAVSQVGSASMASRAPGPSKKNVAIVLVIAVLLGAALSIWSVARPPSPPAGGEPSSPPAAPTPSTAPAASSTPVPAPSPSTSAPVALELRFESTPPGATVREDGLELGLTPFSLALPPDGVTTPRTFVLTLDGHEPKTIVQVPTQASATLRTTLERAARAEPSEARPSSVRPRPRPRPTAPAEPVVPRANDDIVISR